MKKTISITTVFLLAVFTSQAQKKDTNNDGFIAFKVGANYSNVYDENDQNFTAQSKFGLAVGGYLHIPLGKYFGIQPEVLLSQKGFKATGSLLGSPYNFTRTTTFIDIPLLFVVKPIENFSIVAGPQYSYLTNRKDVFENSATSSTQEQAFNNDNIRKNLLSFVVGTDITSDNVVLGLRAAWDVVNNNGDGTSSTPRYKNQWIQATIGFKF